MTERNTGLWWLALLLTLAALGLALVGCARTENRLVDPAAFTFWVMPF